MTENQKRIIEAAELLGGLRALSRILGVAERTARAWASGERNPRPGIWADLAQALEARATNSAALATRIKNLAQ